MRLWVLAALLWIPPAFGQYDVLISGGRVIDGAGNPWFVGDVAIQGDRIVAVGVLGDAPAKLKIDADLVVLSACNTAAGGEKGDTEALSGLARAFFDAGAHALLVSHWYVDSQAAVKLMTTAFGELKRDSKIGLAEAFRRAMLIAMTDKDRPKNWTPAAHPAVWAPFVVVGEGGAAR